MLPWETAHFLSSLHRRRSLSASEARVLRAWTSRSNGDKEGPGAKVSERESIEVISERMKEFEAGSIRVSTLPPWTLGRN